ncbi:uncharacterized protein LOC117901340 [Drosophila subobscura]|uniref:uncharacterized protein LOC117901340 n=1 Tax=Drosophila subobscura TaxID=7241 RepID=UPI00155B329B|nr:uncharacterized protein LOC117901340 [Drosophila subobscura]
MQRLTSKCKWGCIFIILMLCIALYYDTEINGQGLFEASATGKVLNNAGLLPHLQKGCHLVMVAIARVIKYVNPYILIVTQMVENLWQQLVSDAGNIYECFQGYFNGNWTVEVAVFDHYAPNLSQKLKSFAADAMGSYNETASIMEDNLNQILFFAGQYNKEFNKKVDEYAQRKLF